MPVESGYLGGAAYRNRTDDLRITRGLLPARARASCTDGIDHCTDRIRRADTTWRAVPRTVPRLRPLRLSSCYCA
jgi:hypothetical protein